jgi:hypothetical protein
MASKGQAQPGTHCDAPGNDKGPEVEALLTLSAARSVVILAAHLQGVDVEDDDLHGAVAAQGYARQLHGERLLGIALEYCCRGRRR